jgi:hypothetical protein
MKEFKEGDEVEVINVDNYKDSYAEDVPFKATITEIVDGWLFWVTSLETGKVYELYDYQIKE